MKPKKRPRRAATGAAPLRLDMRVRNFGPIKGGAISLRPLTIFIGPTNTGKSYAAMLAHSIVAAGRGAAMRRPAPASVPGRKAALDRIAREVRGMLLAMAPGETRRCPPAMAARISDMCRRGLRARLEREIEANFSSPLQDMARRRAGRFSVSLESGGRRVMAYGGGRLALGSAPKIDVVLEPTKAGGGAARLGATCPDGRTVRCRADAGLIASEAGLGASRQLCGLIEERVLPGMIPGLPAAGIYLPASRTGMLQAHRAIASAAVRGAPYGGADEIQAPRLPGPAADLVSAMIDASSARGPYYAIGDQMESDMLGGHVVLRHSGQRALPEPVYRQPGGDVPVHRASSTVSELAPLTLALKHLVARGGMIAVEEPEAHLHPGSLLSLARYIVMLVRGGVNVMMTTHSGTLFEAIGQYLEVGAMEPEARRRMMGADGLYLSAEEIAPHLFAPGEGGGSTAKKIAVSARDGVSQEEFVRVEEILSGNNARIAEQLG